MNQAGRSGAMCVRESHQRLGSWKATFDVNVLLKVREMKEEGTNEQLLAVNYRACAAEHFVTSKSVDLCEA